MKAVELELGLSVGDVLSQTWAVFRDHFADIAVIMVLTAFPSSAVFELVANPFVAIALSLVLLVLEALGVLAVVFISDRALKGESIAFGAALRLALDRLGSAIGTAILAAIILTLLSLALFVPGIIYGVYYSFGVQAVALRNKGSKQALDYSKGVVKGHWAFVFGFGLLLGAVDFTVVWVFRLIAGVLGLGIVGGLLAALLSVLALGAVLVADTVLFLTLEHQRRTGS